MTAQPTVTEHVLQGFHCTTRETVVVVQYDAAQLNGANLTARMGMRGAVVEWGKEKEFRVVWCDTDPVARLCHAQAANAATSQR